MKNQVTLVISLRDVHSLMTRMIASGVKELKGTAILDFPVRENKNGFFMIHTHEAECSNIAHPFSAILPVSAS